ncbi:hypothetical protein NDN08_001430 [Rhodosorus marinus]|uniref:Uncharacterized protein n=1 Tax=Rhodosorus marinus TaxID=101924 RepID=A0AAV8UWL9_9RHOD|nr:hypothetical protein NDN08_001430 [Rhodosorus marinus]
MIGQSSDWGFASLKAYLEFTRKVHKSLASLIIVIVSTSTALTYLFTDVLNPLVSGTWILGVFVAAIEWQKYRSFGRSFGFKEFIAYRHKGNGGTGADGPTCSCLGLVDPCFSRNDSTLSASLWTSIRGIGLDWSYIGHRRYHNYVVRSIALITNFGGMGVAALLMGWCEHAPGQPTKSNCIIVEKDHTLIIGWNAKVLQVIEETIKAGEQNGSGCCIVVLSTLPKEEMETKTSHQGHAA